MDMKLAETIKDWAEEEGEFRLKILPEYRPTRWRKTTVGLKITCNPIKIAEMILHAPDLFQNEEGDPLYETTTLNMDNNGTFYVIY